MGMRGRGFVGRADKHEARLKANDLLALGRWFCCRLCWERQHLVSSSSNREESSAKDVCCLFGGMARTCSNDCVVCFVVFVWNSSEHVRYSCSTLQYGSFVGLFSLLLWWWKEGGFGQQLW